MNLWEKMRCTKKKKMRMESHKENIKINIQFAFFFSPKLIGIENSEPLNYLYRQFIAIFIFQKIEKNY